MSEIIIPLRAPSLRNDGSKLRQHAHRHDAPSASMSVASGKSVASKASRVSATSFTSATSSASASVAVEGHQEWSSPQSTARSVSMQDDALLTSNCDFDGGSDERNQHHEAEAEAEAEVAAEAAAPKTLFDGTGCNFFGRDEETRILQRTFDRMMQRSKGPKTTRKTRASVPSADSKQPSAPATETEATSSNATDAEEQPFIPAAFVWGTSGTGKSQLVDVFCDQLRQKLQSTKCNNRPRNIHVLKGKFEEHQQSDPFSAITQALSNWCKELEMSLASALPNSTHHDNKSGGTIEKDRSRSNDQHTDSTGNIAESAADAAKQAKKDTNTVASAELHHVRSRIKSSFLTSQQKNLLLAFVPSLSILFNEDAPGRGLATTPSERRTAAPAQSQSAQVSTTDMSWNRFQYTFTQFLTIISSAKCPVILVLDDLQWASQECMDLMLTAVHQSHFLWIGTVRQEMNPHLAGEVLELHHELPFMVLLADMQRLNGSDQSSTSRTSASHTDIHLNNFTSQQLRQWVSEILQQNDDAVDEVANLLHRQTKGNIFFTIQLLQSMERKRTIVYDRSMHKWQINSSEDLLGSQNGSDRKCSTTRSAGTESKSIVQLISSQLRTLPLPLQKALVFASYIRSSFKLDLLQAVWDHKQQHGGFDETIFLDESNQSTRNLLSTSPHNSNNNSDSSKPLAEWLEQAVLEGLLTNSIGGTSYQFAHDRIQQAAHDLVPIGETRAKLRLCIGQCLWNFCTKPLHDGATQEDKIIPSDRDAVASIAVDDGSSGGLLFVAVEHLNCVPSKDHLLSARRNLLVGEHALRMAALAPAAKYLKLAHASLGKVRGNPWHEHYDLTLRLVRARCDVELSLSRFELGYALGHEALNNAKTVQEKLPTFSTMADALGKEGKSVESMKLSQEGALLCGEYPKRGYLYHVVSQLFSARAYFKRTTNEQYFRRNRVTANPQTLETMNFLRQIMVRGFLCQDALGWMLATVRMVHITHRDGICGESAMGLVAFAMIHLGLGDFQNAKRYVALAGDIMTKLQVAKNAEGWACVAGAMYINSFCKPTADVIHEFQRGHASAMSFGDFELGLLCWNNALQHGYVEGCPLSSLMSDADALLDQLKLYKVDAHAKLMAEQANAAKYMSGVLKIDWDFMMDIKKHKDEDPHYRSAVYWHRMVAAVFFGKYENAEILFHMLETNGSHDIAYVFVTSIALFGGLMAANRYRQTKQRKYFNILRTQKRLLKSVWKTKGDNALHRYLLLRAEMKLINATKAKGALTAAYHELAIDRARATRHLHEAGIACELAGEHLLRSTRKKEYNEDRARHYFTQAMEFYEAWGAAAKCKNLRETRGSFIDEERVRNSRQNRAVAVQEQAVMVGNQLQGHHGSAISSELASAYTPVTKKFATITSIVSKASSHGSPWTSNKNDNNRGSEEENETRDDDDMSVLTDMS